MSENPNKSLLKESPIVSHNTLRMLDEHEEEEDEEEEEEDTCHEEW